MTESNTLTIYVNNNEITIEANEVVINTNDSELIIVLNHSLIHNNNIQSFMDDLRSYDKKSTFYHNHIHTNNVKKSIKRILKLWINYYCSSKNNVVAEIYINGIHVEEPIISKARNIQDLIEQKIFKSTCSIL